ncbi:uncharacterized protein C2845_PM01G31780 [Panicum miliaceum]|uniref:Uncharacterized protein n=1 Tax=Panicum miliaceum TaxID=4540 RepID=A0A3L6TJM7_PANMI|nr:uncharacterized protein C2845_PM01G31780 [Panicum miliaceum]
MTLTDNWHEWREEWMYIAEHSGLDEYVFATTPTKMMDSWLEKAPDTPLMRSLTERVLSLKTHDLTGAMVIADAVRHCLSPLRQRPHLVYTYYGVQDGVLSVKTRGLTGAMVIADVVRRCLSPLRQRPRLAYTYYGVQDST